MNRDTPLLLWLDLETTGLDVIDGADEILEIGTGITTIDLHQVTPIRSTFIQLGENADSMKSIATDYVIEMHTRSGLWDEYDAAMAVDDAVSLATAERAILNVLDGLVDRDALVTIAGLGVSTFDIPIIKAFMPSLARRITYYPYDVSSFERVVQSFIMGEIRSTSKSAAHRASADIQYAQDLARTLRHHMYRNGGIPWLDIFLDWRP